jgi:hypothetical protein
MEARPQGDRTGDVPSRRRLPMERRRHFGDDPLRDLWAALVREGRDLFEEGLEKASALARERPAEALLGAFLAGILTALWLRRER